MDRYTIATPLQCNTINMNNLNSSWFSSCLSFHQILVWGQTVRKPPEDRRGEVQHGICWVGTSSASNVLTIVSVKPLLPTISQQLLSLWLLVFARHLLTLRLLLRALRLLLPARRLLLLQLLDLNNRRLLSLRLLLLARCLLSLRLLLLAHSLLNLRLLLTLWLLALQPWVTLCIGAIPRLHAAVRSLSWLWSASCSDRFLQYNINIGWFGSCMNCGAHTIRPQALNTYAHTNRVRFLWSINQKPVLSSL